MKTDKTDTERDDVLTIDRRSLSARPFTAAGTVHSDAWGTSPVAGATVVLTPVSGAEIRMVTSGNGTFHTDETLATPFSKRVSKCPHDVTAISHASSGSCNGCHTTGDLIHLP